MEAKYLVYILISYSMLKCPASADLLTGPIPNLESGNKGKHLLRALLARLDIVYLTGASTLQRCEHLFGSRTKASLISYPKSATVS